MMDKLNSGTLTQPGSSDGIYRDGKYVVVISGGQATVNTVQ